jgi:hypothetical protein
MMTRTLRPLLVKLLQLDFEIVDAYVNLGFDPPKDRLRLHQRWAALHLYDFAENVTALAEKNEGTVDEVSTTLTELVSTLRWKIRLDRDELGEAPSEEDRRAHHRYVARLLYDFVDKVREAADDERLKAD